MPRPYSRRNISLSEVSTVIVWCVSLLSLIWRYTGGAISGTPEFLIGTGIGLIVLQVFYGILICLMRYIVNPPFGFVWLVLSLVLCSFTVSVAVAGADIARVSVQAEIPVTTVGYDLSIVVCQSIFIAALFSLGFNAGSHTRPPPWAHRRTKTRAPWKEEDEEDVVYAAADDTRGAHVIGDTEA